MQSLPDGILAHIQNTADPAFRYRMMRRVIEVVRPTDELFLPLLNLVTTFIDGLASGGIRATKRAYLDYLSRYFPDLVAELPAADFYTHFRCGAVHDFSPKPGYGIARGFGMGGAYVVSQRFPESGQTFIMLNIDRLVDDFLRHVQALERSLHPT